MLGLKAKLNEKKRRDGREMEMEKKKKKKKKKKGCLW